MRILVLGPGVCFTMKIMVSLFLLVLMPVCSVVIASESEQSAIAGQEVTLYRDDWGVPHLYADSEEAGYYGLGYAQAEDRLEQILGMLVVLQGRRSELQGDSHLQLDMEIRRWRHLEEGVAGFERMSPQLQKNYGYYVSGIKRFMADNPNSVPVWSPEFGPASFVSLSRMILWLGYHMVDGPAECEKAGVVLDRQAPGTSDATPERASNGWVVMPARTLHGETIVGSDPHVGLQSPAYYEYRIDAGALKSSGFSLGPMLWQAHNSHVAWAMTTGNPDMWDCYEVVVDSNNPRRFMYDGHWQNMELREEIFRATDGSERKHVFEYTRHNGLLSPVVARKGDRAYVVSASQMHDAGVLDEEIYRMNLATSVAEVKTAMAGLGMFPQNIIVGDNKGNALYVRAGKVPRRPEGFDWTAPVPGNNSKTAWLGYHSFDDLVQVENPEQAYLQNNNIAPDRMFARNNIDARSYPKYLFNDEPGRITTRGIRAIQVLSQSEKFGLEDAFALSFDEQWVTADAWLDALVFSVDNYPNLLDGVSADARTLINGLQVFDGVARADSVTALQFLFWRQGMGDILTQPEFATLRKFPWHQDNFTSTFAAALFERAEHAAGQMTARFGGIDIQLGKLFQMGRGSQSWPVGGETIKASTDLDCMANINPLCDRTFRAFESRTENEAGVRMAFRGSQSMRVVVLGETVQSYSLHSYGQSNLKTSPHWDDQIRLASERHLKPTYFNRKDLDGHITSTKTLSIYGDFLQ